MNPPLDLLIQSLEHIIQQLTSLEIVFSSSAETRSQRSPIPQKNAAQMEIHPRSSNAQHLSNYLSQSNKDGSKE
jgi:hypothetical protein